jgi:hypothetical protein
VCVYYCVCLLLQDLVQSCLQLYMCCVCVVCLSSCIEFVRMPNVQHCNMAILRVRAQAYPELSLGSPSTDTAGPDKSPRALALQHDTDEHLCPS